jgi:hypothetical protein
MNQLDSENGDYDLTSSVTVLTDTPDASNPKICQAYIAIGDGSKDLDGTGGDFEVVITVGSQTLEPSPQTVTFSTATRVCIFTHAFPVPANTEVVIKLKSPNIDDDDVDVTVTLYDVTGGTDQTGDAYAYLGTNLGAAGVNAVEAGGDGDQFTAITSLALSTENSDNLIAVVNAWLNGGRLDLLIDAIKTVTDAIPDSGAMTSIATAANQATMDGKLDTISSAAAHKTGYKLAADGLDLVLCGGVSVPTTLKRIGASVAPSKSEAPTSTTESFYWNSVKVMTLTYSTSGDRHYVDSTVYH